MSAGSPDAGSPDPLAYLRGPDGPLPLILAASVLGELCRLELSLFAWLGEAAPSCGSPEEVVWASSASLRAAWRASQLETLLPVSVGLPRADVAPAPSGLSSAHGVVTEVATTWYKVLAAAYSFRLDRLSSAADGPLERVLQRVLADLEAEQRSVPTLRKLPGRGA